MLKNYGKKARRNLNLSIVICGCLAISSLISTAKAQDTVLNIPQNKRLDSINSDILKQKRFIEVFTPADYKPGTTEKYDVLYALDGGNWNTGLVKQVQRFLEGEGYMPPTIIVSIMGIDRDKELTPTHVESSKNSGGADNFLGFIKNELIPYINKNYPSNGENIIWGHSLSAMFVVYALLNEPATFTSYIAVDPSIWWDDGYVAKMAAQKLPALPVKNMTLFVSGRDGREFTGMKIDTLEIVLKKAAPANLNWKVEGYPGESHSSVRFKSTYDALKFTYAGFTSDIQFHPMNGIVLKDKPIQLFYFEDTSRMHYTVDGTVPTALSAKVQPEITITGPAMVTYKRFTNRSYYDKIVTGNFTTEKMPPPATKPKNSKPGGFNYSYFEGDWDKWPDLKSLRPVKKGITDKNFDIDKLPRENNYALVIDGLLEAKEEGYYMFLFKADKNSRLYLGNKLLIQLDSNHIRDMYTYIVPLSKGFYPFRIEYLHKNKDFPLAFVYLTPSIMSSKNPVPIPLDAQYSLP